jgi:hypothetical protein
VPDRGGNCSGREQLAPGHGEINVRAADIDRALLPSRQRMMDLRTMNTTSNKRVLLTVLSVRTSSKGNQYLSGFLSKALVVGFPGEPDKFDNPTWNIYLSEPEVREAPVNATHASHRERQERVSAEIARGGVDADWDQTF